MVDWKPVTGVIPPLSDAAWQTEFNKYKAYPEYQLKNKGMSLNEFKKIFYFEYGHRVLGRLIGLIFLLPFMFFYFSKRLKPGLIPKLIVMFILGGLQGLLGWYMVKSGLVNEPRVSQYRLTAHLAAAVIIYGYILWVAFDLLHKRPQINPPAGKQHYLSAMLTSLIFLMILSGGLVAGTQAGFAYNTFPLMAGALIPDGLFYQQPWWINVFENITTIQFNHRLLAYITAGAALGLSYKILHGKPNQTIRRIVYALLLMLGIQIALGISTLVHIVPITLASMHQAGAIFLLTISLLLTHQLKANSRI